MLEELRFVHGSVAKKDYVPELQHFKISGGRIEGFNGSLALSTPIDLDLEAMPKAVPFVKAIERLPEGHEVALNLTQAGKLSVKAGPFRAYVECWGQGRETPHVAPRGEIYGIPPAILVVARRLAPFMGIDASRPWACGILFDGQLATATNNIVLVQQWMEGISFPSPINVPSMAIREMLRIGQEPVAMQPEPGAITFHYANGAWLRTQLLNTDWPDLTPVLEKPSNQVPFPLGFFDAVRRLDAFGGKEGRVYLRDGLVTTSTEEGVGALVELPELEADGCFHLSQLALLDGVAQTIDWTQYPAPCLFYGENLRGVIAGIRQ